MEPRIEKTADGSATLYRADIDEHYHSVKGAVTESVHVYINCGLLYRAAGEPHVSPLQVLEVGFGTGLNAVLAAMTGVPVIYCSIEKYPLTSGMVAGLEFGSAVDRGLLAELHSAPWDRDVAISDTFTLRKVCGDMLSAENPGGVDVVFMDAFSPEKQPELWTRQALGRLVNAMAPGAVLVTYCAKGVIRRTLQELGLTVERLAGPPGGKREILRGIKGF